MATARASRLRAGRPKQRQRLIDVLGVLRAPQTAADRSFAQRGWPEPPRAPGSTTRPDRSLIRLATVTPWGAKVFLVPLTAPTNHVLRRDLGETVALWVQGIGWSDFSTLGEIRSGSAWGPQGSYRRPDGTVGSRFFEIVPDNVARVGFYTHVQLRPFRASGLVTAAAHHNIAAFQVKGAGARLVAAVWYAADGRVIKRVGDWHRGTTLASPTRPCRTSQLEIKMGHNGPAAGTVSAYIEFINRSVRVCDLRGWPTLIAETAAGGSARAGNGPASEFAGVTATGVGVPTVTLKPNQRADAVFSAADGQGITPCGPRYRTLRLTPPANTKAVTISAWIPNLDAFLPSCSHIHVSPTLPSSYLYKG